MARSEASGTDKGASQVTFSGQGLALFGMKLAAGSTDVTISENARHAILAQADSVGGRPAGMNVSGNSPDAVYVTDSFVTTTQTWLGLGIPYLLSRDIEVAAYDQRATLTLAAGAELRFPQNSSLRVGGPPHGRSAWAGMYLRGLLGLST